MLLASDVGIETFDISKPDAQRDLARAFVRDGFVLIRGLHSDSSITMSHDLITEAYRRLESHHSRHKNAKDVNGWAVSIVEAWAGTPLHNKVVAGDLIIDVLCSLLGPDLALFGYDALWINVPSDTDPVLLKNDHVDAWTGTSTNTIFSKVFFTDCDNFNGVGVAPGSHLQGLIPVYNRALHLPPGAHFDIVNLNTVQAGDVLMWHPLLVHRTVGHSPVNTRISMTSRYTSTETPFSSQERALGYRTLRVGPMNEISRLVGNDFLTPFRTFGGHVGIDRRMADLYPNGEYQVMTNYNEIISDLFSRG